MHKEESPLPIRERVRVRGESRTTPDSQNKRLFLCDYDGTITLEDVTNLLVDYYTGTGWRETVLTPFRNGEIDHLQVMVDIYAPIKAPETELVDYSLKITRLRPGFAELYQFCLANHYDFVVVSGGLDFYIKPFMLENMRFFSYTGALSENGWLIRRPDFPLVESGQDFKVRVMEELKSENHYTDTIFCGDGRNDFPLAQKADKVFAVENSRLADLCRESGIAHQTFNDFFQVIEALVEARA